VGVTGETASGKAGNDQKPEIAHGIQWLGPETGILPSLTVPEDLLAPRAHADAFVTMVAALVGRLSHEGQSTTRRALQ
jgi:hypothetical protein